MRPDPTSWAGSVCSGNKRVIVYFVANHHIDSHGNSRADTCAQTQLRRQVLFAHAAHPSKYIILKSTNNFSNIKVPSFFLFSRNIKLTNLYCLTETENRKFTIFIFFKIDKT
jgi:hypothetical protein